MMLTEDEKKRYARHLSLPGFGEKGQLALRNGSVLVIGAGGLGSPILYYLAAAGIGHIGIVDGDRVDISNLQRQIIHTTEDIDKYKAVSAAEKINLLNPATIVDIYTEFATEHNIGSLIAQYDFVIDATDSLDTKFMVDDACVKGAKPYNHGAIFQYEGQTMTVLPGTVSYRDLFPDGPQHTSKSMPSGPLGVVPGVLGTIQATEAIKYFSGCGQLLTNRLLRFDLRTMEFQCINLR